jgi:hypothetical protein
MKPTERRESNDVEQFGFLLEETPQLADPDARQPIRDAIESEFCHEPSATRRCEALGGERAFAALADRTGRFRAIRRSRSVLNLEGRESRGVPP